AETVYQAETEGVAPALVKITGKEVLSCNVNDRNSDRRLDNAGWDTHNFERRERKRDRVCHRKGGHDLDDRPQSLCPQDDRSEKRDVVVTKKKVFDADNGVN